MDYIELSERFVAHQFPAAEIAVVGGSTARGTRTSSSDIDLLVIGDELFPEGDSSLATTYSYEGEVFEVFAYTREAYSEWADRGISRHRPVIVHLLVEGTEVRGGEALSTLRRRWERELASGPSVDEHELAMRRYAITDLLDDLRDSVDDLERNVLAWAVLESSLRPCSSPKAAGSEREGICRGGYVN